MVSVLACPVSAPTLAGLFLFDIVFDKLRFSDAVMVSYQLDVLRVRLNAALPVLDGGLMHSNFFCKPVIGLPALRLQSSKVFSKQ